jgi:hypothetical protein
MKPATSKPEATTSKTTKAEASITAEPSIRIVKIASCPSLSGKSTLKYNVGCTPDSTIYFRVFENSGGGFFSHEWISLAAIQKALDKASSDKELTSFLLYPLFSGRSQNSPGFVFAALQSEGLVSASTTKRRCYELTDWAPFQAAMQAWAASGQGPELEGKPAKGRGKAPEGAKGVKPVKVVPTAAVWGEGAAVSATLPSGAVDIVPVAAPEVPAASTEKLSAKPKSSTPAKTSGKTTARAKGKTVGKA